MLIFNQPEDIGKFGSKKSRVNSVRLKRGKRLWVLVIGRFDENEA